MTELIQGFHAGQRVRLIGENGQTLIIGTLYQENTSHHRAGYTEWVMVSGLVATTNGVPYQARRVEAL